MGLRVAGKGLDFLLGENIHVPDWPSNIPDWNPIEDLWYNVKNNVLRKQPPCDMIIF